MTCWGTERTIQDIKNEIENLLATLYKTREENGFYFFTNSKGVEFHVCCLGDWPCVVIEYMDTMEDGDLWYPEDYPSIDNLIEAMKAEIEEP